MSEVFLKIINMSIAASWLALAVLVLRLVLKKAPKWVGVLLWGIVAVRLICPFSIESALSLIPSAETVSPDIMMDWTPEIHTGVPVINSALNPVISEVFAPNPATSANPLQILIPVASVVWLFGIGVLLLYAAISYWQLRRKVATAVLLQDGIYQSEAVGSPFVLGVWKPKIYLPFRMEEQRVAHVIAHEQAHIHRKDHWWKPLGFLLLAVHWFNPLMWLAYVLLCRDIELACDEYVIKELENGQRAEYTQALVDCSVKRRMISACPLAFGEVGVKDRVKSVLHYKKPAFWVVILSVLICGAVAVCFLTDPKEDRQGAAIPVVSDAQTEAQDSENDEGKEVSPILSRTGQQIGTRTIYEDDAGRVVKKVEELNTGEVTETTYSYYPNGKERERTVQNLEGLTRTQRREDGSVAFIHREEKDRTVDEVYDEAGNRSSMVAEYLSGKREEFVYDERGNMISWDIFERDQHKMFEFQYHENGNRKTEFQKIWNMGIERYYNEDGNLTSEIAKYESIPGVVVQELSRESIYDADGNRTTKTLYRDGKCWEVKHDATGNRVWEKTTQPDGSTVEIYYGNGGSNRYLVDGKEIKASES